MHPRISVNPRVCNGKPVIRGTRIPVSILLEQLEHGETSAGLLQGYPALTEEDIRAVFSYARSCIEMTDFELAAD